MEAQQKSKNYKKVEIILWVAVGMRKESGN